MAYFSFEAKGGHDIPLLYQILTELYHEAKGGHGYTCYQI